MVQLKNGDTLTCEIKKLDLGVMTIDADATGKISVHWGEVLGVTSPRQFEVQVASGDHYLGSFLPSAAGRATLSLVGGGSAALNMEDVIRVTPIGGSTWSRMDGSVDAGFSFTQAELETHWTVNGSANYRSPRYQLSGTLSSQKTTREDADPISRNNVALSAIRLRDNRWYTVAWTQFQQNQELSLDLRVLVGGGLGRDLVHTNHRLWSVSSGVVYTHERFADEEPNQSAELAVGGELDFFTSGTEDFKITNGVVSYFNVSGRKRVRVEFQNAWRHEFLKDFYWSLNGYDSFDGDPPDNQKSNDFGVSFTLGWKF